MKEPSIEQKAQAYDGNYKTYAELINRLEDVKDAIKKQNYGIAMDILYKPYPQFQVITHSTLKESEYEKIRKILIDYFDDFHLPTFAGLDPKNILAWLEKQGKKDEEILILKDQIESLHAAIKAVKETHRIELEKQAEHAQFCDSIQVGDKVTRNEDGVLVNLSQLKRVAKKDEKQGEQNLANSVKTCKDRQKSEEEVDNLHDYLYGEQKPYGQRQECVECQFNYAGECKGSCAMKRGEQKPADKFKLKFKVGDWVVNNNGEPQFSKVIAHPWPNSFDSKIKRAEDNLEVFINTMTLDKQYHLWTIQDAKDGDVLFTSSTASHETFIFKNIDEKGNAKCYFAYDSEDGFREGKYHFIGRATDCKPATKEQRDLLFQKMKEAGYEWDAEKKELKKIEQKSVAWSEEDKKKLNRLYHLVGCMVDVSPRLIGDKEAIELEDFLKSLKDRIIPQPKQDWSEEDETRLTNIIIMLKEGASHHFVKNDITKGIDWLKSLKNRYTWKPSYVQMEVLLSEVTAWTKGCPKQIILESLYNDLRKLKG